MTPASRAQRAQTAVEILRVNVIVGRAKAKLSQEQLAKRSGVSRPTISRIERAVGDVGIEVVERIAHTLGTSIGQLFVPARESPVDDSEIARRMADPESEFIDARDFLAALDEAAEPERYSRAGRPRMDC
jgi:transcriptional regulator with XRE-family HTH domain